MLARHFLEENPAFRRSLRTVFFGGDARALTSNHRSTAADQVNFAISIAVRAFGQQSDVRSVVQRSVPRTTPPKGNTMKATHNYRVSFDATTETVTANIKSAKSAYAASNDSAALSAGNIYLVWLETLAPQAHADLATWMNNQIADVNKTIDEHNEAERALKARVGNFRSSSLDKSDPLSIEAKNDHERAEQAADRESLTKLTILSKTDWAARRKVRIEHRENASKFSMIVRFTLGLYAPADASIVSRYAKVVQWIEDNFAGKALGDVDEIVTAIKAAGGFDRVINAQRGNPDPDNEELSDSDKKAIAEALTELSNSAVMNAPARASFDMAADGFTEGIVTLLGRYKNGKVEVVAGAPVAGRELDHALSELDPALIKPSDDTTELIARVLSIGDLVSVGESTNKRDADLKSGAALPSERVLALVPWDSGGVQLIISARYADASIVVKATTSLADFDSLGPIAMLPAEDLDKLRRLLESPTQRSLIEVAVSGPDLIWTASNTALVKAKSTKATRTFEFVDISMVGHKPLNVTMFRETARTTLTTSALEGINAKVFDATRPTAKQAVKPIEFLFTAEKLTVSGNAKVVHEIPISAAIAGVESLSVRAGDLFGLIKLLLALKPTVFDLSADPGGLLKISWKDRLANYEVFLPTVLSDGKLNPRRVEPMRPTVTSSAAA